ncbi:UNVERIFIED_CONTAM: hypothetical protein K2H54_033249 [Gekko kuhli]
MSGRRERAIPGVAAQPFGTLAMQRRRTTPKKKRKKERKRRPSHSSLTRPVFPARIHPPARPAFLSRGAVAGQGQVLAEEQRQKAPSHDTASLSTSLKSRKGKGAPTPNQFTYWMDISLASATLQKQILPDQSLGSSYKQTVFLSGCSYLWFGISDMVIIMMHAGLFPFLMPKTVSVHVSFLGGLNVAVHANMYVMHLPLV